MKYRHVLYNLMSWATGKERRVDNILATGDWKFFQIGNYTPVSPLIINQGVTTKLTFQAADIFYTAGRDLNINYDYTTQKFLPQTLNDVFFVEVRFKCKCSAQNGHADVLLESPSFAYNPVNGQTFGIPKAANNEQFVSLSVPIFIGQDLINNGIEVKVSAGSGNFSIYDVSFMITRLSSGIQIT